MTIYGRAHTFVVSAASPTPARGRSNVIVETTVVTIDDFDGNTGDHDKGSEVAAAAALAVAGCTVGGYAVELEQLRGMLSKVRRLARF